MAWRSGREDQAAVEGMTKMLVVGLIILAVVIACSFHRMEQVAKTPQEQERERAQHAAMIQARWEAAARAKAGVKR